MSALELRISLADSDPLIRAIPISPRGGWSAIATASKGQSHPGYGIFCGLEERSGKVYCE